MTILDERSVIRSDRPGRRLAHLVAQGGGVGCLRFAPGTWGTLLAVPPYLLAQHWAGWVYGLALLGCFALGVWACQLTGRDLGVHDHPSMVWDEMVGYWLTMAAMPAGWGWALGGVVAFRLFDIWKPWPIGLIDRYLGGGAGVMLDDVAAALYAAVVLQLCLWGWQAIA